MLVQTGQMNVYNCVNERNETIMTWTLIPPCSIHLRIILNVHDPTTLIN